VTSDSSTHFGTILVNEDKVDLVAAECLAVVNLDDQSERI